MGPDRDGRLPRSAQRRLTTTKRAWKPVAVVVDLTRRKVADTRETPTYYADQASVPKPVVAPDPTRFRIENGSSIRNCSS
ncbi:MAG: hypothetical protein QOI44_2285 [Actinomycetota bacterium]|jgi:hypothetical protein|nr:hypothetical protein [Actinomycetota bacterium]